jgi:methylenetetrahydrofolate dehydrogenase (NADP+)/methenyltetrahydrofolate cyclohydrolase
MPPSAQIIDGKAAALRLRTAIAEQVAELKAARGITPGLAVVLVGEDPASQVYVRNKHKACVEAGMHSFEFVKPASITQEALLNEIAILNLRPDVHGILVQLPLPAHINPEAVINAIAPHKDVDGFHVINAGKLMVGAADGFVPCTPLGCLKLLKVTVGDLSGKHAVVLGRSNIVGKPMAQLLLRESCTVTICHSKTADIQSEIGRADILIAAIGKPEFVQGEWLKPGCTVIDVGINRIENRLVGDVHFASAAAVASAITPVPGGVGPMTIACLLENTLNAARAS